MRHSFVDPVLSSSTKPLLEEREPRCVGSFHALMPMHTQRHDGPIFQVRHKPREGRHVDGSEEVAVLATLKCPPNEMMLQSRGRVKKRESGNEDVAAQLHVAERASEKASTTSHGRDLFVLVHATDNSSS